MNLFKYECKKIWNWRILVIIGAMGVLVWFAFLSESLQSYKSLTTHGIYGSYQKEMFELYGDTLEPEELAAYDIPGKKEAVLAELNGMIAAEAIFKENEITNYAEYEIFLEDIHSKDLGVEEEETLREITSAMQEKLESGAQTLDEWYESPLQRFATLKTLEDTYVNYEDRLRSYIDLDSRPVVVDTAKKLLEMNNGNLVRYDLANDFSYYVVIVSVFSIIAVIVMIAPYLTTDRMEGIHFVQYSSTIGRRIFRIQFAVTMLSTFIVSIVLIILAYIPYLSIGGMDYWNSNMMSLHFGMQLYNITFGQYAWILAGLVILLNITAASFTFILARYSQNIIVMMMKAVPLGIAIAGISMLSIINLFSDQNIIFTTIFRGKVYAPEVIVCVCMTIIGLIIASLIIRREKHVDVV